MDNIGLTPPQAIEAEQSILGAMMTDSRCIDDILFLMTGEEFYRNDHQLIFTKIKEMAEKNLTCDFLTVCDYLSDSGKLDSAGGLQYVGNLAKNTINAGNFKSYVKIVREKAALRAVIECANDMIAKAYQPDGMKADEIVGGAASAITKLNLEDSKSKNKHINEVMKLSVDRISERLDSGAKVIGLTTGLRDVDNRINGQQEGKLIIIAGRPSMGKSSLAMNFGEAVCAGGGVGQVFTMEMPHEEMGSKIISSQGSVDYGKLNSPVNLEVEDWPKITSAVSRSNDWKLYIDTATDVTINHIRNICRKTLAKEGRLDWVMIDYLQLMKYPNADNETQALSELTRQLKNLCGELGLPIVLLSQLSRAVESRPDKRPVMSDLRGSGSIEQDADIIIFVYRDEVYNPETEYKGVAELGFAKIRGGKTGIERVNWNGANQRFENADYGYNNGN